MESQDPTQIIQLIQAFVSKLKHDFCTLKEVFDKDPRLKDRRSSLPDYSQQESFPN